MFPGCEFLFEAVNLGVFMDNMAFSAQCVALNLGSYAVYMCERYFLE